MSLLFLKINRKISFATSSIGHKNDLFCEVGIINNELDNFSYVLANLMKHFLGHLFLEKIQRKEGKEGLEGTYRKNCVEAY